MSRRRLIGQWDGAARSAAGLSTDETWSTPAAIGGLRPRTSRPCACVTGSWPVGPPPVPSDRSVTISTHASTEMGRAPGEVATVIDSQSIKARALSPRRTAGPRPEAHAGAGPPALPLPAEEKRAESLFAGMASGRPGRVGESDGPLPARRKDLAGERGRPGGVAGGHRRGGALRSARRALSVRVRRRRGWDIDKSGSSSWSSTASCRWPDSGPFANRSVTAAS